MTREYLKQMRYGQKFCLAQMQKHAWTMHKDCSGFWPTDETDAIHNGGNGWNMEIYFAPMEGITGYIYRNAFHDYFTGVDKYFTPFLSPNQNRALNPKEIRDVLPENNKGMQVVPQIS